jgi:hypothetical protein
LKEYVERSKDVHIGVTNNKMEIAQTVNERDSTIDDFYAKRNKFEVDLLDEKEYKEFSEKLSEEDKKVLNSNKQFYELTFSNKGGLVMPIILEVVFDDNTTQVIRIPAEIWRQYEDKVSRVLIFDKQVVSFRLDPFLETADTDVDNNSWPKREEPTRYELFKQKQSGENLMQRQQKVETLKKGQ